MIYEPTRADDDQILRYLELRTIGVSNEIIGERFGLTGRWICKATNKIVRADAELHGDMISFKRAIK